VATGLHVLARLVPAVQLASDRRDDRRVPASAARAAAVLGVLVSAAVAAVLVVGAAGSWTHHNEGGQDGVELQGDDR
jgi:hypothetical protein